MKKQYDDLTDYELTMLELRWEEEHPDESAPVVAADWESYYKSLPDDTPVFRKSVIGLQIQAEDNMVGSNYRCCNCDGPVDFTEVYDADNNYLGDGYHCPYCARTRLNMNR